MASCSKSEISHGSFINTCNALHGDTCGYICDNGYIQQPIVRHVVCQNGKWSVNPDSLCIGMYLCSFFTENGDIFTECELKNFTWIKIAVLR